MVDTKKEEAYSYLEKHAKNVTEAYAITTKKVAELRKKRNKTIEEFEALQAWKEIRNHYAVILADEYLQSSGYKERSNV